jgi:peptidoglycan-associated lipoprotein
MNRLSMLVVAGVAVAAVSAACGGSKPVTAPTPVANADSAAQAQQRAHQDSIEAARQDSIRRAQEENERIARQHAADSLAALGRTTEEVRGMLAAMTHFDFDKAILRPEDTQLLDQKIAILQKNPNVHIRISGHCDERGSDEYNLALGNRRATAAKQYLVSHGIDAARIETVSYGEERPLAQGHDEAAWSQNRRDEFEITAGGDVLTKP